jgi:hypothetical protein
MNPGSPQFTRGVFALSVVVTGTITAFSSMFVDFGANETIITPVRSNEKCTFRAYD